MRNIRLFLSLLFIGFLNTCNVEVNKDLSTGLYYSCKGLSIEKAYLAFGNVEIKTNEIEYGKKVNIVLEGVKGYKLDNGKVELGCKIVVTDNEGKSIISVDDAFAASNGGRLTPGEAEILGTALTIGKPMEIGKEYNWESVFWDKNGKGTISTEIKVKVLPIKE